MSTPDPGTVTVTYRCKRWYLAFSKLPGHAPFGPYDLHGVRQQLESGALLHPAEARGLAFDARLSPDHTATAEVQR